MYLLAVDTSTPLASVALSKEGEVLAEIEALLDRSYGQRLIGLIDQLLTQEGGSLQEIELFAFSQGPGSFTGLRIGLSTIEGFVMALGGRAVAVSTLETLSLNASGHRGSIVPWLDARKKEIYGAIYHVGPDGKRRVIHPEVAMKPERFLEEVDAGALFLGQGALAYRSLIESKLGEKAVIADASLQYPKASKMTQLAWEKVKRGEWVDFSTFSLRYLRPSEAELRLNVRKD